jgi:uncharacterized protein (TIGR02598 family)
MKNNTAFTLIEITVSLMILAIGLVGILALFPVGFDASGRAASITEATFLAQELIEDAKRVGYTVTTTTSGIFPAPYSNYEYDTFVYDEAALGVAADLGLHEVVVRVYWPSNGASPNGTAQGQKLVELSTYLAKYEP